MANQLRFHNSRAARSFRLVRTVRLFEQLLDLPVQPTKIGLGITLHKELAVAGQRSGEYRGFESRRLRSSPRGETTVRQAPRARQDSSAFGSQLEQARTPPKSRHRCAADRSLRAGWNQKLPGGAPDSAGRDGRSLRDF